MRRVTLFFVILSIFATQIQAQSDPRSNIAYMSNKTGKYEIYMINPSGQADTPVTTNYGDMQHFSWSPDGSKIVFTSNMSGNYDLYLINRDGSGLFRLTEDTGFEYHPSFSPDGLHVVYSSDISGDYEIYRMEISTKISKKLTDSPGTDYAPSWSPDGTLIAFSSKRDGNHEIYTMNATNGTELKNLTNDGGIDDYPIWSKDNETIWFHSYRTGNCDIYTINRAGGPVKQITNHAAFDGFPSLSPDESEFSFTSDRNGSYDIFLYHADSTIEQLTDDPAVEIVSGWAPAENPDRAVLTAFFNALNGNNWTNNTNWLSAGILSTWYGVTTNESGRVTELQLVDNNLSGILAPEIGGLTELSFIQLENNAVSGTIPVEVGNLQNLVFFDIKENQLSGSIPQELCNINTLQIIELNANNLTGSIPANISNLLNLRVLTLGNNNLSGSIPVEIWNMTELSQLYLDWNNFTPSPLPASIGNLVNMQYFSIVGCGFTGQIPPEIGNMTNLLYLLFGGNNFEGSIPQTIGNLSSLQVLSLADNQLEGTVPVELKNLTNLVSLNVQNNQLTGSIPQDLGMLLQLNEVKLNGNQFTWIPDLSDLPDLNSLHVQNNKMQFGVIEPNVSIPEFIYAPQAVVGDTQDIVFPTGIDTALFAWTSGSANEYAWFHNDSLLQGISTGRFPINSVNHSHAGTYRVEITNTVAPELTLFHAPMTVTVTEPGIKVRLIDSNGIGIAGGSVQYYDSGWISAGITDKNGDCGIDYSGNKTHLSIKMTFAGYTQQKSNQDISEEIVFQTIPMNIALISSDSIGIEDGSAQYYASGWKQFGVTDSTGYTGSVELLPGKYSFKMTYAGYTQQKSNIIISETNPLVYQTLPMQVKLVSSDSAGLSGGSVKYYASGWKPFGETDSTGCTDSVELLPGKYSFKMTYAGYTQQKSNIVISDTNPLVYQTLPMEVALISSDSTGLAGGTVQYYASGWKTFDETDTTGYTDPVELLPGKYSFKMTYAGYTQQKSNIVIADSNSLVYQTLPMQVKLVSSDSTGLSGGSVKYYASGWKPFGETDSTGFTDSVELLSGKYSFKMTYAGATEQKSNIDIAVINPVEFRTFIVEEEETVMDIDGNTYRIIKIGNQAWMIENLKVTRFRNGEPIPFVDNNTTWYSLTTGAYTIYDNDINNTATYGNLYNWYAVNDNRGLAPEGWRVPTDTDWKVLEKYLGMSPSESDNAGWRGSTEGGKLKEVSITHWKSPNTGATNETGFTARPGGFIGNLHGGFRLLGSNCHFWSSTETSDHEAWNRALTYNHTDIYRYNAGKYYGFSIRCVKDIGPGSFTVLLKDSQGRGIPGGLVQYYASGWKSFGVTDENGIASGVELLPGNYSFKMTYAGYTQQKSNIVISDSNPLVFQTIPMDVMLVSSDSLGLQGGNVKYYASGWKEFGVTDLTGYTPSKELLPGKYSFKMTYAGAIEQKSNIDITDVNPLVFKTVSAAEGDLGTLTDIDGNTYRTIKVGNQWWMAENLKVTHYVNGDFIDNVKSDAQWVGLSTGAQCDYNNDERNVLSYGRLYNWYAVNDTRGLAPEGWRVPTDTDWKVLEKFLGMSQSDTDNAGWRGTDEGGKLKEVSLAHWRSPNTGATNETGFTALPGGFRSNIQDGFQLLGNNCHFWSSTENGDHEAWNRAITYSHADIYRYNAGKFYGFSIRCVKDAESTGFTVVLKDSQGKGIQGGTVQYYASGWKSFGVTDENGVATGVELLPGKYSFKMTFSGYTQQKSNIIITEANPLVFQTLPMEVALISSDSTGLAGGTVQYYASGWKVFNETDSTGYTDPVELLPGKYSFKMLYSGMTLQKSNIYIEDTNPLYFIYDNNTLQKNGHNDMPVVEEFRLHGNYPNPFNPITQIRFDLPEAADVKLVVYSITGQEVARLLDQNMSAGYHSVEWDASKMSSGVYLYKIEAGKYSAVKRMILIK